MSGVHPKKMQFNPQVELDLGVLVKKRAEGAFSGSGSACVAAIIQWWKDQGAPPLNDAEQGLLAIGKLSGYTHNPFANPDTKKHRHQA
jgi:hypothetical protein